MREDSLNNGLVAATVLAGLAGCASSMPTVGSHLELTGQLRITGNEPFPVPVLQLDDGSAWELGGLPSSVARPLAGQRISVGGTVVRAPKADAWMPSLRVDDAGPQLARPNR